VIYNDFILGALFGGALVLCASFLVAWAITRIARLPSPTGVVYQPPPSEPLPFVITNDAQDARHERKFLDAPEGLGR
jgi:hypothetical protein